jgi:hypothetical protein
MENDFELESTSIAIEVKNLINKEDDENVIWKICESIKN